MKNLGFMGYDKYAACASGKIYSIRSGKFLVQNRQVTGYYQVTLSQDGKRNNFSVHRLIALAHIKQENPEQNQVNHKNGDKSDNSVSNLEWMTAKENCQHAHFTGLASGTRNPDRSLTDEVAHKVCQLIEDSWRNKDIADALGINQQIVGNIRFGRDYQDIACQYDFKNTLPSRRKISVETLIKICEMLEEGNSLSHVARTVGVSSATVHKVRNRKSGIYISKNYKF
jgi:DNA-binding Xre family transcriptional regulator